MIDKLYKKLYLIFISSIMLIITTVIFIFQFNNLQLEREHKKSFFQRMNTLIIYQLSGNVQDYSVLFQGYEQKYQILGVLKDENNEILYRSESNFLTDCDILLNRLGSTVKSAQSALNAKNQIYTEQNGILVFNGNNNDTYLGMPSTIVLNNGKVNYLTLIFQQNSTSQLIGKQLPFYLVIWITAFLVVLILSYILLRKTFEPTKKALKSQKNFITSASHELKSPLAVISANAEAIEGSVNVSEKTLRHIHTIDSECQRMSHLIQDMLVLASSDAKTWSLNKNEINVDTLLITLYENYAPLCMQKGLSLNLDLLDISYPTLNTDGERLSQILGILLDNAIHYSYSDSNIQLQTSMSKNHITFYVIDHGKGISEDDKPYIFDRFYCADKSRTEKEHFGLGLSIAEELTRMLGGKIGLEDTAGGGCTFYISFPIKT